MFCGEGEDYKSAYIPVSAPEEPKIDTPKEVYSGEVEPPSAEKMLRAMRRKLLTGKGLKEI